MHLTLDDSWPAHLTRVHATLTSLPEADQARPGVTADWKTGHQLTYRQTEHTFRQVLGKDEPDGAPAEILQAACDRLLEASIPADWTDIESWSRPPRRGSTGSPAPWARTHDRRIKSPLPRGPPQS